MTNNAIARFTGLSYLGLAISGVFGFLIIRDRLFDADDAQATLANLVEHEGLARWGIAAFLGIVMFQALAAVGFWSLYRKVNATAAAALMTFGLMNSVAILVGTMFSATALEVALDPTLAPGADAASTAQLLYHLEGAAWGLGNLFFGLWLIPMGYLAWKSGYLHAGRVLGAFLLLGGIGYVAAAFVGYLAPAAPAVVIENLPIFANVGEFWTIGALSIIGVRKAARSTEDITA